MNTDKTVNAEFSLINPSYTLTINTQGNGIVIIDPDQQSYNQGDIVELSANPDEGWVFSHWEEDYTGNANPINIIIDEDTTITADFSEIIIPQVVTITDIQPADNSIDIPIDLSELEVTVQNNKQTPITYLITTQPPIGSTQGTIIQGTITCPLNMLQYQTTYTWTLHLHTENGWENTSYQFTTESA